jgi:hypothetical protein
MYALFEYLEDHVLLLERAVLRYALVLGHFVQFGDGKFLKISQVELALLDPLVLGVSGLVVAQLLAVGLLFGIGLGRGRSNTGVRLLGV